MENKIIISGKDLKALDQILGDMPYRISAPIIEILNRNVQKDTSDPSPVDKLPQSEEAAQDASYI